MKANLVVLVLLSGLIAVGCGSRKTGENAVSGEAPVKEAAPDYKMTIIAKVNVKPEKAKDFIEAAKEIIEKSNQESGCRFYQLYQDPYDSSKFVFVEEYDNQQAVDAHFAADYFNAFGPKIADYVAGPAEIKILSVAKEVVK
jgi:quinol monooxygenase YgiN